MTLTHCELSAAGKRSTEDLSDPCGYICHLCDDPGGPLPCQCGLPQQPPRCRCHSIYSCTTVHTSSRCKYLFQALLQIPYKFLKTSLYITHAFCREDRCRRCVVRCSLTDNRFFLSSLSTLSDRLCSLI